MMMAATQNHRRILCGMKFAHGDFLVICCSLCCLHASCCLWDICEDIEYQTLIYINKKNTYVVDTVRYTIHKNTSHKWSYIVYAHHDIINALAPTQTSTWNATARRNREKTIDGRLWFDDAHTNIIYAMLYMALYVAYSVYDMQQATSPHSALCTSPQTPFGCDFCISICTFPPP